MVFYRILLLYFTAFYSHCLNWTLANQFYYSYIWLTLVSLCRSDIYILESLNFCFDMIVLSCFRWELLCWGLDSQVESRLCVCVFFWAGGFRLTQTPLANSANIDKQLLFPIGSPNLCSIYFSWVGVGLENLFLKKS